MKIGILQTGYAPNSLGETYGEYPEMFAALLAGNGFNFQTYKVLENEFPSSVTEQEGWLVTGSGHGAYEDHEWIPPLEDFIRASYNQATPIVGVCFGHQIIAQALGGKVEKFGGDWGLGFTTYKSDDGKDYSLLAMHQDQVTQKPDEADVIISNDFCTYAGLAYKGKAISFQPHPEFSPEFYTALLESLDGNKIPSDQAQPAYEKLKLPNDAQLFAKRIADFYISNRTAL